MSISVRILASYPMAISSDLHIRLHRESVCLQGLDSHPFNRKFALNAANERIIYIWVWNCSTEWLRLGWPWVARWFYPIIRYKKFKEEEITQWWGCSWTLRHIKVEFYVGSRPLPGGFFRVIQLSPPPPPSFTKNHLSKFQLDLQIVEKKSLLMEFLLPNSNSFH